MLNNYGGFYTRWVYVHELKKAGANVHLPCVNHSGDKVNICEKDVFLGLIGISGLEGRFIESIPAERCLNGLFNSLEDFITRTAITLEQCIILIRVGALRFTGLSKKRLLWEVYNFLGHKPAPKPARALFSIDGLKHCSFPEFDQHCN